MFIYRYAEVPYKVEYSKKSYQHVKDFLEQKYDYYKHHTPKRGEIKNDMEQMITVISNLCGFDEDAFLNDNFTAEPRKSYISIKSHDSRFSCHQPHNSQQCTSVNLEPIMNEVLKEINYIHSLPTDAFKKEPLKTHVRISELQSTNLSPESRTTQGNQKAVHILNQEYDINHSEDMPYPYSNFYRKNLAPLWNPYQVQYHLFTAKYTKFQLFSSHLGTPTVLLTNVRHDGKQVSDHCFLFHKDLQTILNSNINQGDRIGFYAIVRKYIKDNNQGRKPYIDFEIKNVIDVQGIPYNTFNVPSNRLDLLKMIGQQFTTPQLQFILSHHIQQKQRDLSTVQAEINPLQNKLNHLNGIKTTLNTTYSSIPSKSEMAQKVQSKVAKPSKDFKTKSKATADVSDKDKTTNNKVSSKSNQKSTKSKSKTKTITKVPKVASKLSAKTKNKIKQAKTTVQNNTTKPKQHRHFRKLSNKEQKKLKKAVHAKVQATKHQKHAKRVKAKKMKKAKNKKKHDRAYVNKVVYQTTHIDGDDNEYLEPHQFKKPLQPHTSSLDKFDEDHHTIHHITPKHVYSNHNAHARLITNIALVLLKRSKFVEAYNNHDDCVKALQYSALIFAYLNNPLAPYTHDYPKDCSFEVAYACTQEYFELFQQFMSMVYKHYYSKRNKLTDEQFSKQYHIDAHGWLILKDLLKKKHKKDKKIKQRERPTIPYL